MKNLFFNSKNILLMMSLFLSLALVTSCSDDEDGGGSSATPSTVNAAFTSQVDAENSLTYSFMNGTVVNGITDRTFTSSWDFGGDGTSSEESPSFTFSTEGTYEVTMTATASDGVEATATETIEVTAPINRFAVITDTQDDDTGELRLGVDSIQTGTITFNFRVAEGPVDMNIEDGFINCTGSSTSGRNSIVELRLKDDAPHAFREGASDETIAAGVFPDGVVGEWVPVSISWASDGTNTPTYTVEISGQTVITDAPSTTRDPNDADQVEEHLLATIDGVRNIQWKYASNSTVSDGVYHVDDIMLWSLDSGTPTVIFEDNFQGRVAGSDLNPGDDMATPYHENTTDATVGEDQ